MISNTLQTVLTSHSPMDASRPQFKLQKVSYGKMMIFIELYWLIELPLWDCGLSPSELMFGRKIRFFIPMLPSQLNTLTNAQSLADRESQAKERSSKH